MEDLLSVETLYVVAELYPHPQGSDPRYWTGNVGMLWASRTMAKRYRCPSEAAVCAVNNAGQVLPEQWPVTKAQEP